MDTNLETLLVLKRTEEVTNNGVEKSCMFWAESSRIVCRSWTLSSVHTGPLDHTEDTWNQINTTYEPINYCPSISKTTVNISEAIIDTLATLNTQKRVVLSLATYHRQIAMLFSKSWKVIVLKPFQNIV